MKEIKPVTQPEGLNVQLFEHQLKNIRTLEKIEKLKGFQKDDKTFIKSCVGVLGDPPGTGKTFTIIGLLCRDKMEMERKMVISTQTCSNFSGNIQVIEQVEMTCISTNLIVVPSSIVQQWENSIAQSDLLYTVVTSKKDCVKLSRFDVVICIPSMYNYLIETCGNVCFKRYIHDEMDTAYIPGMLPNKALFSWFISATFSSMLERIHLSRNNHYLKQLFNKVISQRYSLNELLEMITVKTNGVINLGIPEYKLETYDVVQNQFISNFKDFIEDDVVKMIESGNIRDAIKTLGGQDDDQNIPHALRQKLIHKITEAKAKIELYTETKKQPLRDEWNDKLQTAETRLKMFDKCLLNLKRVKCPCCYIKMEHSTLLSCCQQIACSLCMITWFTNNSTCPFCRSRNTNQISLSEEKFEPPSELGKVEKLKITKFDHLLRIAARSKKILIFSMYNDQFPVIAKTLEKNDISYSLISGTSAKRQKLLDEYIYGSVKVLLLNSRENGAGLNLQNTTDIILWHQMDESLKTQCIGRANRIGLKHELTVHQF